MPFISIAIRNSNLYAQSWKEAQTNKVLLELATIVFDESSTTVDNLVSRILSNTLQLLECERCQVILLNNSINNNNTRRLSITSVSRIIDRVYELNNSTELPYNVSVQPSDQTNMHSPVELDIINSVIDSGKVTIKYNVTCLTRNLPRFRKHFPYISDFTKMIYKLFQNFKI